MYFSAGSELSVLSMHIVVISRHTVLDAEGYICSIIILVVG